MVRAKHSEHNFREKPLIYRPNAWDGKGEAFGT
jgi:hypothetical protein